jgi:hypothetical protein
MLLAEGGRLDVHYSHWGAQSVLSDALRGPDPFIRMIQECTKDDSLIQDAVFAEGIAFVDRDRHELMIWGGVFIRCVPVIRRAYMQALAPAWRGWQVDWCRNGIIDAWRRAGMDSPKFKKARAPVTEEALGQTGYTWVTILTDRAADYSFRPAADGLLLVGPRLVDLCAARESGRPPLEDNLGGGILIDAARRTMAWWHCESDPPEADLAEAWSGWQISRLEGGLPEQMDRSGRDGRQFALSQQRIDECLAHDLSRSADFDPIAVMRKLAGEGGTVNPEALKWPRADD